MKKLLLITLIGLFAAVTVQAQKIKMTDGNIAFLKGVKSLKVEFTYGPNLKVGKMTEEAYVEKKVKEAKNRGEEWRQMWLNDRKEHYQPKFIALFNKVLEKKGVVIAEDAKDAPYTMIVNTSFIEPGFDVGVASKPAYVNLTVTFVKTDNPSETLAKFTINKSPGTAFWGNDFDSGVRIGEAYAKAGKYFAKYLLKKKAF